MLFYPTNRLDNSLPDLKKDIPVQYDYLAGQFNGNTSESLAFYYAPPACLRLLEPDLDSNNRFILAESLMREASALSDETRILNDALARIPAIYGPEPVHGWCYYFEKADLARQRSDWEEVVSLGEAAFKLNDHPNNPVERFVFIEGYAHMGDWERAMRRVLGASRSRPIEWVGESHGRFSRGVLTIHQILDRPGPHPSGRNLKSVSQVVQDAEQKTSCLGHHPPTTLACPTVR